MKRLLKIFGIFALIGSLGAGVYYFLFVRSRSPQVELYFDDGSMLTFPGNTGEAAPFIAAATAVLTQSPLPR
jgi:hypothetical protein